MAFRGFGKSRPRHDGKAEGGDKGGGDEQSPSKKVVSACENRLRVLEPDFDSQGNEPEKQQQDDHQTLNQKQYSSLNSLTRPSDSGDDALSATRPKHARKRSYSLPADYGSRAEEKHKTRSEAVTLLRARTLSRLSNSDRPSKDITKDFLNLNLNLPSASAKGPANTMVREQASIMDFVTHKQPKKKNKSNKKKKGPAASSDVAALLQSEPLNTDVAAPPSAQPTTADESSEMPETPEVAQTQTKGLMSFTPPPRHSNPSPVEEKHPCVEQDQVKLGSVASESPDFRVSTPKSTGTATSLATSWTTNPYTAPSPQTTATFEPSSGRRGKQASGVASRPVSVAPSLSSTQAQVINTHAHPSPLSSSTITRDIQTRRGHRITSQKPEGFFWQLDSHGFPCAKSDCNKRCNLWDGATVICPRCGPYSETRYCSREHLLEDVKAHWANCGQDTFQHPCRESTIAKDVRDGPPLIRCLHQYDTPERHRQAVYFNMHSRAGDYFIFSDWIDILEAGFPDDHLSLRCSSRILHVIKFTDPGEKDRFRRALAACLFITVESHELTDYLFRLIRDKLRSTTLPPTTSLPNLETSLKYQLFHETAVSIQPDITGERHACETDWTGTNRRNCHDPICRSEYGRLLGKLGGGSLQALVKHLEGSYWILRAVRTTHPDVKDAKERMMGKGFEDVAEEDCRVFRRGDGWDGAGSGEMEVEGINA